MQNTCAYHKYVPLYEKFGNEDLLASNHDDTGANENENMVEQEHLIVKRVFSTLPTMIFYL